MSDMVERAAVQIYNRDYEFSTWQPFATYDGPEKRVAIDKARAVLLAAIDLEDENLTGLVFDASEEARAEVRPVGRSIIDAIRKAIAQGEGR